MSINYKNVLNYLNENQTQLFNIHQTHIYLNTDDNNRYYMVNLINKYFSNLFDGYKLTAENVSYRKAVYVYLKAC